MAPQQDQEQPPMDAARRRIRAVSAHLSPPAPAAGSGLDANPTAGEYAHGPSSTPLPCLLPAHTHTRRRGRRRSRVAALEFGFDSMGLAKLRTGRSRVASYNAFALLHLFF